MNQAMRSPRIRAAGRYWTQAEWDAACVAGELKKHLKRSAKFYPLAVKQVREQEYDAAERQRSRRLARERAAASAGTETRLIDGVEL